MKSVESENLELYFLCFSAFILFSCLSGFIIYFMVLYKNRQLKFKQEQADSQAHYKQEILKTQIEIQEQTQTHISREIHDNISQVLSFVKLDLAMLANDESLQKKDRLMENRELIAQVIIDLRDLSKSLSFDHITKLGLIKTIELEIDRLTKSKIIEAALSIDGGIYSLGEQRELLLFRIFQECLNNTLKHAAARHFKVEINYLPQLFSLTITDDGDGFLVNSADNEKGAGLKNIEKRAALIGALASVDSAPANGCITKITLNPVNNKVAQWKLPK